jgi:hypothetical protein
MKTFRRRRQISSERESLRNRDDVDDPFAQRRTLRELIGLGWALSPGSSIRHTPAAIRTHTTPRRRRSSQPRRSRCGPAAGSRLRLQEAFLDISDGEHNVRFTSAGVGPEGFKLFELDLGDIVGTKGPLPYPHQRADGAGDSCTSGQNLLPLPENGAASPISRRA